MTLSTPDLTRVDAIILIRDLMQRFAITSQELYTTQNDSKTRFLQKLMVQGGSLLIFAGLATFIGMQWETLTFAVRLLLTLGAGFGFLLAGIAALQAPRFQLFITPLFLIAVVLQPYGLRVLIEDFWQGDNMWRAMQIIAGFMALQQGILFLLKRNTIFLTFFLIFMYGLIIALTRDIGMNTDMTALAVGLSLLLLGYRLVKGSHHELTRTLYGLGTITVAISAFNMVHNTVADILLVAVSTSLLVFSLKIKNRSILFLSVISFFCYLGYYTDRYFSAIVGWPLSLMLVGAIMIGISFYTLRLGKKF